MKKALKIAGKALTAVVILLVLYIGGSIAIAKINDKPIYIFNLSFSIVVTDSMTSDTVRDPIEVGDFIAAKKTDISEVKVGDDVVYISLGGTLEGQKIIHRVIKIETVDGVVQLYTQGIKSGAPIDAYPTTQDNLVGVKVYQSAELGDVVAAMSKPINWVFIIILLLSAAFAIQQLQNVIFLAKHPQTPEDEMTEDEREKMKREILEEIIAERAKAKETAKSESKEEEEKLGSDSEDEKNSEGDKSPEEKKS